MENAVDALKMAAAILIFIIAIASSFSLFGTAKQTADSIITMRDKQVYLEAEELEGVLYTSSQEISTYDGFTQYGDRIVGVDDIISTITRYTVEKYGVTIIDSNSEVIARFDTSTEDLMEKYTSYKEEDILTYQNEVIKNISTIYCKSPKFSDGIQKLYEIDNKGNSRLNVGAPWFGDTDDIQERIKVDIFGGEYIKNPNTDGTKIYKGKNLINEYKLNEKTIVEVTNEIDRSKYLEDNGKQTDLPQEYSMPTVEIVYIILD